MRFKVDENLSREVSDLLNRAGHDAISVGEQGLSGSDDRMIYGRCQQEKRALITLDVGFANLQAYEPRSSLRRDRPQAGAAGQAAGARGHGRHIAVAGTRAAGQAAVDRREDAGQDPRIASPRRSAAAPAVGRRREAAERALLKRNCQPEDIADAILFLAVGGAMVTGQTLVVDGGLTL